jgi:hypothetical protein
MDPNGEGVAENATLWEFLESVHTSTLLGLAIQADTCPVNECIGLLAPVENYSGMHSIREHAGSGAGTLN